MRILDSTYEKHDMETPAKPKRLPITQKFYAFYHAPIVKFWFNTVRFFLYSVYFIWKCSTDFWVIFPTCISDSVNVKHYPKSRQKTPYLAELEMRNTSFYETA